MRPIARGIGIGTGLAVAVAILAGIVFALPWWVVLIAAGLAVFLAWLILRLLPATAVAALGLVGVIIVLLLVAGGITVAAERWVYPAFAAAVRQPVTTTTTSEIEATVAARVSATVAAQTPQASGVTPIPTASGAPLPTAANVTVTGGQSATVGNMFPVLFDGQSTGKEYGATYDIGVKDGQIGIIFGSYIEWNGQASGDLSKGCGLVWLAPGWYPKMKIVDGRYEIYDLPGVTPAAWTTKLVEERAGEQHDNYGCTAKTFKDVPAWTSKLASPPASGIKPLATSVNSAAPAATPQAAAPSTDVDVSIQNFAFSPASYPAPVGDTVVWKNNDTTAHTVTADDGSFNSGPIEPGATYSHMFSTAGTIPYHCNIHPNMHGTIVVSAPTQPSAPKSTDAPSGQTAQRRSTGQNATLAFQVGETVYGWKIALADGRKCDGGNCYLPSAPAAGQVTSGVINPWPGEVPTTLKAWQP